MERKDTKAEKKETAAPTYPPEILELVAKTNAGDASAVPGLRKALREHPELVDRLGDLAAHAEEGLVGLAAGSSLAAAEAIRQHLAGMRRELGEAAASPLEKLLVGRVVLSWLSLHAAEVARVEKLAGGIAEPARAAAERRLDRAHARFLSAARTLATVRKLIKPAPSPLELAMADVAETGPRLTNRFRDRAPVAAN